jgi:hypothetical protein
MNSDGEELNAKGDALASSFKKKRLADFTQQAERTAWKNNPATTHPERDPLLLDVLPAKALRVLQIQGGVIFALEAFPSHLRR